MVLWLVTDVVSSVPHATHPGHLSLDGEKIPIYLVYITYEIVRVLEA